jgi:hypothetical protein
MEVGITHCICLLIPGQRAPPKHWMNDPENMESTSIIIDIPDDEDTTRKSFEALQEQLGPILTILGYLEDVSVALHCTAPRHGMAWPPHVGLLCTFCCLLT